MKLFIAALLILLTLPSNGYAADPMPFPFDENGSFEIPSSSEVCASRKALAEFKLNTSPSKKMQGEIIVEGIVTDAHTLPNKKQELSVDVQKVLFGDDGHIPTEMAVISPMERYGGISIAVGETYKILLFPLGGKYFTWASAGSAPEDESFGGYYECRKQTVQ
jgi:hypothetical protein